MHLGLEYETNVAPSSGRYIQTIPGTTLSWRFGKARTLELRWTADLPDAFEALRFSLVTIDAQGM